MAAVPVQQVGDYSTQSTTESPEGHGPSPHGKDYYLREGLEGIEYQGYDGPDAFTRAIESQADKLCLGAAGQYVAFSMVTQHNLMTIDRLRDTHNKSFRYMYLKEEQALIVKIMPGRLHEVSHRMFARMLVRKAIAMGIEDDEFVDIGNGRLEGRASQKEPDTAFIPITLRPLNTDFPTLVFECGVSESLQRLRVDGNWWLENSEGETHTVLLISVNKKGRRIILEQWEMATVQYPATLAHPIPPTTRPKRTRLVNIVGPFVPAPTIAASAQAPIIPAPAAPIPVPAPAAPATVPAPRIPAPATSPQAAPVPAPLVPAPVQAPIIPVPSSSAPVLAPVTAPPTTPVPVVVTGAPLTFDFSKVFLRSPVPSRGESNIIFTSHDLENYARNVWRTIK